MTDLEWHENKLRRRMEVAAPQMLAALKMARDYLKNDMYETGVRMDYSDTKTLDTINAAIAEAEGRNA
jgi:hypothetical protein